MKLFIAFLLMLLPSMAVAADTALPVAGPSRAIEWKKEDLADLTMELDDPKIVEWMRFGEDGLLPITLGEKEGAVAAPTFKWEIVDGKLRILEDNFGDNVTKVYDELTLVSRSPQSIVVRRQSGQLATYKITTGKSAKAISDPFSQRLREIGAIDLGKQGTVSAATLQEMAAKGISSAQYALSMNWQDEHRSDEKALVALEEAAKQGDAQAQLQLGWNAYFFVGTKYGAPNGFDAAVGWWRKAAEQGNAFAQYALGGAYYDGQGVAQDYAEAAKWYRKAADQGVDAAQNCLGYLYQKGLGVPQDNGEAYFWVALAVRNNPQEFKMRDELIKPLSSAQKPALIKRVREWKPAQ